MLRDKRVQAAELREARLESFKCLEIREASGRVKETLAGTDGDGIVSHWIFTALAVTLHTVTSVATTFGRSGP